MERRRGRREIPDAEPDQLPAPQPRVDQHAEDRSIARLGLGPGRRRKDLPVHHVGQRAALAWQLHLRQRVGLCVAALHQPHAEAVQRYQPPLHRRRGPPLLRHVVLVVPHVSHRERTQQVLTHQPPPRLTAQELSELPKVAPVRRHRLRRESPLDLAVQQKLLVHATQGLRLLPDRPPDPWSPATTEVESLGQAQAFEHWSTLHSPRRPIEAALAYFNGRADHRLQVLTEEGVHTGLRTAREGRFVMLFYRRGALQKVEITAAITMTTRPMARRSPSPARSPLMNSPSPTSPIEMGTRIRAQRISSSQRGFGGAGRGGRGERGGRAGFGTAGAVAVLPRDCRITE